MFVAQLANLQAHDKVLDACSAPGGKACHMAEILAPTRERRCYRYPCT